MNAIPTFIFIPGCILLCILVVLCILTAVGFMLSLDPVSAAQTAKDLVSIIEADAALLYPPSTHPNIEIATHREPSPIPTRHPSRDGWIAALFTRDDKGKVLILLSVEDTFPSSRAGALRLLARKVKEAVKEAEREKVWAKLRETEEYEWTVHSRNEEEGFVVVEEKKK